MKELRSGRSVLALAAALSIAFVASVFAEDVTTVGYILHYPDSFNREIVTLKGTATAVVQNLGREGVGSQVCIQDFSLDDGTGTIPVRYIALCETVDAKVIEVYEGDQVIVTATVDVPPDDIASAKGEKPRFMVMATKITKSKN
jgi:hypothetical protein